MYYDIHSTIQSDVFMNFYALIMLMNQSINLCQIIDSNTKTDHLAFVFVYQHIWATFLQMGASSFVIEHGCEKVVGQLITKLQG